MHKRNYTLEFKQEAVKLIIEQGYTHSDVSKRLGIPHANLSRWVQTYRHSGSVAKLGLEKKAVVPEQQELEQLRKEVKRLRLEREILKKAAAFFAVESC